MTSKIDNEKWLEVMLERKTRARLWRWPYIKRGCELDSLGHRNPLDTDQTTVPKLLPAAGLPGPLHFLQVHALLQPKWSLHTGLSCVTAWYQWLPSSLKRNTNTEHGSESRVSQQQHCGHPGLLESLLWRLLCALYDVQKHPWASNQLRDNSTTSSKSWPPKMSLYLAKRPLGGKITPGEDHCYNLQCDLCLALVLQQGYPPLTIHSQPHYTFLSSSNSHHGLQREALCLEHSAPQPSPTSCSFSSSPSGRMYWNPNLTRTTPTLPFCNILSDWSCLSSLLAQNREIFIRRVFLLSAFILVNSEIIGFGLHMQ